MRQSSPKCSARMSRSCFSGSPALAVRRLSRPRRPRPGPTRRGRRRRGAPISAGSAVASAPARSARSASVTTVGPSPDDRARGYGPVHAGRCRHRRHLHRRRGGRRHGGQGAVHARRPWPGRPGGHRRARRRTARRRWPTAPRSPPTPCWRGRRPRSRWSPPRASATSSRSPARTGPSLYDTSVVRPPPLVPRGLAARGRRAARPRTAASWSGSTRRRCPPMPGRRRRGGRVPPARRPRPRPRAGGGRPRCASRATTSPARTRSRPRCASTSARSPRS